MKTHAAQLMALALLFLRVPALYGGSASESRPKAGLSGSNQQEEAVKEALKDAQISIPPGKAPDEPEIALSTLPFFSGENRAGRAESEGRGAQSYEPGDPETTLGPLEPAPKGESLHIVLPDFDRREPVAAQESAAPVTPPSPNAPPPLIAQAAPEIIAPVTAPAGRPPQPPLSPAPNINVTPEITAPVTPAAGRSPQPPLPPAPSINVTPEITAPVTAPVGRPPQPPLPPAPRLDLSAETALGITPSAPSYGGYSLQRPFPFLPVSARDQEPVMPSIHKAPPPPAPSGMVLVPGGTFEMGRGGQPARKVQIDRFWMRATPVTQEEYQRITGRNSLSGDPLLPAENVSWYDALEFCNILSLKEGLTPAYSRSQGFIVWDLKAAGYRLPTEAEWEYAAQGAENDDSAGWYAENSGGRSRRVGEKKPNRAGLYDLLGNVWEWCWNWDEPSSGAETRGIWGGSAGTGKVVRGGSWNTPRSQARSANRRSADPLARYKDVGFRPVRSIFEPPAP